MTAEHDVQRLSTEFDNTDELVTVLVEDAILPPRVGDLVELYDADENRCYGRVTRIADGLIYVEPDWKTWTPSSRVDFPNVDMNDALIAVVRSASAATTSGEEEPLPEAPDAVFP